MRAIVKYIFLTVLSFKMNNWYFLGASDTTSHIFVIGNKPETGISTNLIDDCNLITILFELTKSIDNAWLCYDVLCNILQLTTSVWFNIYWTSFFKLISMTWQPILINHYLSISSSFTISRQIIRIRITSLCYLRWLLAHPV